MNNDGLVNMDCPKCGYEMRKGFIPSMRGNVYWAPENVSLPVFIFNKPTGAKMLSKMALMSYAKAPSYYCDECNMVLTPVPKELN